MHVGNKRNKECKELKVHKKSMIDVEEVKYLGEILSSDAKNTKNVKSRTSKGMGLVNEILYILENISLGSHYFSIAMILRNTILINGMIFHAEAWSNVSKEEVEELSKIDRYFLCKILNILHSVPTEALYLELGIMEIKMI